MSRLITYPFQVPEVEAALILGEFFEELDRGRSARPAADFYLPGALTTAHAIPLWTLLEPGGTEFIENLYTEILGRPSDAAAIEHYHQALASGTVSKIDILVSVRYSSEGRKVGRRITGLLPYTIVRRAYGVPLLGRIARLAVAILRLPRLAIELQQATRALADCQARLERLERRMASEPLLDARLQQTEVRIGALEAGVQSLKP